jgi:hypothetical protein
MKKLRAMRELNPRPLIPETPAKGCPQNAVNLWKLRQLPQHFNSITNKPASWVLSSFHELPRNLTKSCAKVKKWRRPCHLRIKSAPFLWI